MPASPIRKLVPYAEAAKKRGTHVIHLNIGQPDIKTPKVALDAVRNHTIEVLEYSMTQGSEAYRKKIAGYYAKQDIFVDSEDIIVTTGGSEALSFAMGTIMDNDDEIIIPEPFYANYNGFATAAGVKVKPIASSIDNNFALPPISRFEELITPKTKAILICNPGNPTGYLYSREEIHQLLFDYGRGWAMGVPSIGPDYIPNEVARRKKIVDALSSVAPQPAFNKPPEVITEPFTLMLYGITSESVDSWLKSGEVSDELKGMAASPGKVEGRARVIFDPERLNELQPGEILITRVTAPSWGPVFGKIKATVTDIGGMMSHAAIICREYGLPAVTGTGSASTAIKTGDYIMVDGSTGKVKILEEA